MKNVIQERLCLFHDTFKYERVYGSCFITNRLEILDQHNITCLYFVNVKTVFCGISQSLLVSSKVGKNGLFFPELFRYARTSMTGLVVTPTSYIWMNSSTMILCSLDSLKAQIWFLQNVRHSYQSLSFEKLRSKYLRNRILVRPKCSSKTNQFFEIYRKYLNPYFCYDVIFRGNFDWKYLKNYKKTRFL